MSGPDVERYEDENDLAHKFDQLVQAIKPTIVGKNIEQGIRILQIGIRAYFSEFGHNLVKITDNTENTKVSELPETSHEFQFTDGTLAISSVDEKIVIYKKTEEGTWLITATAEASD